MTQIRHDVHLHFAAYVCVARNCALGGQIGPGRLIGIRPLIRGARGV